MGFGSYKTAWSWQHKRRAAMVRADSEPLGPFVQTDEALVGGRSSPHKDLVTDGHCSRAWLRSVDRSSDRQKDEGGSNVS